MDRNDQIYVFNKRLKYIIKMADMDSPGDPFISLVKATFKTVKAMSKSYMFDVYINDVLPLYKDEIDKKQPFFMNDNIETNLPVIAWLIGNVREIYLSLPPERVEEYWHHIHKLI